MKSNKTLIAAGIIAIVIVAAQTLTDLFPLLCGDVEDIFNSKNFDEYVYKRAFATTKFKEVNQ